jgi:hypothetical protein
MHPLFFLRKRKQKKEKREKRRERRKREKKRDPYGHVDTPP